MTPSSNSQKLLPWSPQRNRKRARQPNLRLPSYSCGVPALTYFSSSNHLQQLFQSRYNQFLCRLGQVILIDYTSRMAPINEDLHELVNKLEARVHQLEQKLEEAKTGSSSKSSDGSVRMILMGPPGAGMFFGSSTTAPATLRCVCARPHPRPG